MKSTLPWFLVSFSCLIAGAQSFEQAQINDFHYTRFHSSSCSWADADGDGDEDLFVTNGEYNEPNEFYLNNGNGTFTAIYTAVNFKQTASFSAAWGDYDNDGDLDLYVANCDYAREAGANNFFYRNEGNGELRPAAVGPPVNDFDPSYACTWVDYDNDGWLDLFVANAYNQPNRLYHNDGNGSFSRVSNDPVVTDREHNVSCSWVDYDNDGDMDLYTVDTSFDPGEFYRNNGDGTFERIYDNVLANLYLENCRSASWGDYNNDGWMDVVLVDREGKDRLFTNLQNGDFAEVAAPSFVVDEHFSNNGSVWGDFDNDGDLDLVLMHFLGVAPEFHRNDGDGRFERISNAITDDNQSGSYAIAAVDVNSDGWLDFFQANRWQPNETGLPQYNQLFYNTTPECKNWLTISLRGKTSNFYGVGAKVLLYSEIGEEELHLQKRELTTLSGGGYSAQGGHRLHFGLSDHLQADSVVVKWPSGTVTSWNGLPANAHIFLHEDETFTVDDSVSVLTIRQTTNPLCPGAVTGLEAFGYHGKIQWFQGEPTGYPISSRAQLPIKPMNGEVTYTAVDVCGQQASVTIENDIFESEMFPNPAHNQVFFNLTGTPALNKAVITVHNAAGQLVMRRRFHLDAGYNTLELDITGWATGAYMVEIESGCRGGLERLVKVGN